eukprot:gene12244-8430_t
MKYIYIYIYIRKEKIIIMKKRSKRRSFYTDRRSTRSVKEHLYLFRPCHKEHGMLCCREREGRVALTSTVLLYRVKGSPLYCMHAFDCRNDIDIFFAFLYEDN